MKENMLRVGTLLNEGAYRIEEQIGSGGFGNTYVVRQVKSGTIFAMKEFFMKEINLRDGAEVTVSIPGKKSTFEAQRKKFRKEAKRLRRLQNKHIVKVHEQFEENSTAYYIMDFINGHSLADIVTQDGPIDENKAMNIFLQVLDALSVVHRQIVDDNGKKTKMLHLDIKPANIMLDKTGNAFLLDFGSSKQIDLEGGLTTDGSGFTLSKGYAPSELLDGNKIRIGPWTDLYELGATLYHILTGMQPPSVSEITDDGSNAFSFPATISENIQQLVLWLMTPSRAKRPQSVAEIQKWLTEHDIVMLEPEPEPEPEPSRIKENDDETVFQDKQTEGTGGNDDRKEDERDEGETIFGPEVPPTEPEEPEQPFSPEPEPETSEVSSSNNHSYWITGFIGLSIFVMVIALTYESHSDKEIAKERVVSIDDHNTVVQRDKGNEDIDGITGDLIIPCKWGYAYNFSEGLACVEDENGKWGYIDKTGDLVIPCKWNNVTSFSEGLARIQDENNKYGYIDKTGNIVIPCKWEFAGYHFSEGLARVRDENGKLGYIDKTGDLVIPCKWNDVTSFSEGLALVEDENGYGYIDKTGNLIIPCKWKYAASFNEGLALVNNESNWLVSEKYGYINKTGNLVIPCNLKGAEIFSEGLACVMDENEKHGYINKNGIIVIPCKWEKTESFSEGLACVRDNNGYGYIDKTGNLVIPCKWRYADSFSEGLARVRDGNGKYGYIDKTGNVVIPGKWKSAESFSEGLARVEDENGKFGYISKK